MTLGSAGAPSEAAHSAASRRLTLVAYLPVGFPSRNSTLPDSDSFRQALVLLNDAVEEADHPTAHELLIQIRLWTCLVRETGDWTKAFTLHALCSEAADAVDETFRARCHVTHGETLALLGETRSAVELFRKYEGCEDADLNLGMALGASQYREALPLLKSAFERAKEESDIWKQTVALNNWGRIILSLGKVPGAEETLLRARALAGRFEPPVAAVIGMNLAEALLARAKYPEARKLLHHSVDTLSSYEFVVRLIEALRILGDCEYESGNQAVARTTYREARALCHTAGVTHPDIHERLEHF